MAGLVHVRRREKRDRNIVGKYVGHFVSGDQIQELFDQKKYK